MLYLCGYTRLFEQVILTSCLWRCTLSFSSIRLTQCAMHTVQCICCACKIVCDTMTRLQQYCRLPMGGVMTL